MRKRRSRSESETVSPKARAVDLLSRREHGADELVRKLMARGIEREEAQAAVDALASEGWQSDMRYAQAIVRARAGQGYGPRRIRQDLGRAGVDDAVCSAAIEAEAIDWLAVAQDWFTRRQRPSDDPRVIAKQVRQLYGRGFDEQIIRAVIQGADGAGD